MNVGQKPTTTQVSMKSVKSFKPVLKAAIFLACFSFVAWQCYLSFQKFLENPRSTSLSMEYTHDVSFPTFTVCPTTPFLRRNADVLKKCGFYGLTGYMNYTDKGYWSASGLDLDANCTDPKKLYENAMNRPEDIMHKAQVYYFSTSSYSTIRPNSPWWKPIHKLSFGRCYELIIPTDKLARGIKMLRFYFLYKKSGKIRVFAHIPGYFLASKSFLYKDIAQEKKITMDFKHEVGKVVAVGGQYCDPDPDYSVDDCVQDLLFNVALNFGRINASSIQIYIRIFYFRTR